MILQNLDAASEKSPKWGFCPLISFRGHISIADEPASCGKVSSKSVQRRRRKRVWKKLDVKYNRRSSVTERAAMIYTEAFLGARYHDAVMCRVEIAGGQLLRVVCVFAGITILLSLSVFQLIVAEMVPSTSMAVPLVGKTPRFVSPFPHRSLSFTRRLPRVGTWVLGFAEIRRFGV